jgi:hypothetical protein
MMTEAELTLSIAAAAFAGVFFLAGMVGLIVTRYEPDRSGLRGPLTLIFGALTAGGFAFFLVLAAQVEYARHCEASTTRAELHGGLAQGFHDR